MYEVDATFDDVDISKRNTYAFNSQSLWQKNEYFRSQKFLLLILGYGLMALITLLSLTNIFQGISTSMRMRRKEFAAYQSMGRSRKDLKRMLSIEAGFYGIIGCVIGIPVSFLGLLGVYDTYHEVFLYYYMENTMGYGADTDCSCSVIADRTREICNVTIETSEYYRIYS